MTSGGARNKVTISPIITVAAILAILGLGTAGRGQNENISAQEGVAVLELKFGMAVTTDKAIYGINDRVSMQLIVFNYTSKKVTFHFNDAQRYDFTIKSEEGMELWRWSHGRMFAQVVGEQILGPDRQELNYTETYVVPPGPGEYKVTGVLTSSDMPMVASIKIIVR